LLAPPPHSRSPSGDARVGTVSSPGIGSIGPRATFPATLLVRLDFTQAADAAMALQHRGGALVGFDAEIRSGPAPFPFHFRQNVQLGY